MEENMSDLFDLIESKAFEDLTKEERIFVLSEMTEEEYRLQGKIIAATEQLEFQEQQPLPLVLPEVKTSILTKAVPLYQVLIAAACLLVGFFIFSNRDGKAVEINFFQDPLKVSLTNHPETVKYIHDTIIKKLDLRSPIRVVRDTIQTVQTIFVNRNETRLLEAGNSLNTIPLEAGFFETKTLSAKDDGSIKLLPKLMDFGSMR